MRVVLLSTYELGRQPFGLASPAAWMRRAGCDVTVADLSRGPLPRAAIEQADLVCFFLPMHTATRLALRAAEKVRDLNPNARLCGYGLYAPLNERALRSAGFETVLGAEFEQDLVALAMGEAQPERPNGLPRLEFIAPDRTGLPALGAYARLATDTGERIVGYTEASRGCKHWCRHCPIVPVYRGAFRVVQPEAVLEDVRQQAVAGAEHITFGDPDFFNGPKHAIAVVEGLHAEWPRLTYDVTVKVEHLLRHRDLLPRLQETGCAFVTSAVESFEDAVLENLQKGHTRADFEEALALMHAADLPLSPTFLPFTPWTTRESYGAFLHDLAGYGLAEQVAPIQLAIRLLIPEGSLLLELAEVRARISPFDPRGLCYPWQNPDPQVDALAFAIQELIKREEKRRTSRREIVRRIWELAEAGELPVEEPRPARATIPYLTEPWYC
jgi:radical SAM superfamily enzyme YgiQ (UPF0313 family)